MSFEQPGSNPAKRPQIFGPVEVHLTHRSEDHERGWQAAQVPVDAPGGKLPPLPTDRRAPDISLAKQFLERVEETKRRAAEKG